MGVLKGVGVWTSRIFLTTGLPILVSYVLRKMQEYV